MSRPDTQKQAIFSQYANESIFPLKPFLELLRHQATPSPKFVACTARQADPASPGMGVDACQTDCAWAKPVFAKIFKDLEVEGKIRIQAGLACLADHNARFDPMEQKQMQQVEALFQQRAFNPPDKAELMSVCRLNATDAESTLRLLVAHKRLARVDKELYFHSDALAKAAQLAVDHLRKENRLESVQWKYLLNTSRKYAIPLLDYLDKIGITKRAPDNTRYLGPNA